jgi:hypothetical protein
MSLYVELSHGTLFELYPIYETTLVQDILYTIQHALGEIIECYMVDKYGNPLDPLQTVSSYSLLSKTIYYKRNFPRKHINVPLPYQSIRIRDVRYNGTYNEIQLFYNKISV